MKIEDAVKKDMETRDNIEKNPGGRPTVDEPMHSHSFSMKDSDYERIRRDVEATGEKMGSFIRRAVFLAHRQLKGGR
jgi:hypothetical protein